MSAVDDVAGVRISTSAEEYNVVAHAREDDVVAAEYKDRVIARRAADVVVALGADDAAGRRRGWRWCRSGRWSRCRRAAVVDEDVGRRYVRGNAREVHRDDELRGC